MPPETEQQRLLAIALQFHREIEGEYGCPGESCPGVQRLVAWLRSGIGIGRRAVDDETRCAVCGWPVVDQTMRGCVRGNCSMRPFPQWFYAPERAAREYRQDLTRFDRRATLPPDTEPIMEIDESSRFEDWLTRRLRG